MGIIKICASEVREVYKSWGPGQGDVTRLMQRCLGGGRKNRLRKVGVICDAGVSHKSTSESNTERKLEESYKENHIS